MRLVAALALVVAFLSTVAGDAAVAGGASAAAQPAEAAEAALGLDRPTRRLIQQGLRNEGFDAGTPDGLFGPRTRGAIRAWQASRADAATGYLNEAQAELLRAATTADATAIPPPAAAMAADGAVATQGAGGQEAESPAPSERGAAPDALAAVANAVVERAPAPESCGGWNTRSFFKSATGANVSACLAGLAVADMPPHEQSFGPVLTAAAQDASAVEVALGLNLATRNEGFDPDTPDGLLGPRTRLTIRVWDPVRSLVALPSERRRAPDAAPPTALARASETVNCDGWNTNAFFKTASAGTVTACLEAGDDLEERASDAWTTPLHGAAVSKNSAVVAALLEAGADVAARDNEGRTPLHYAGDSGGTSAVVAALLEADADVAAQDNEGRTPLHYAGDSGGTSAVVAALLEAGADVAARDNEGRTPLHYAGDSGGTSAVVAALLDADADVAAQDNEGRTPLHYAGDSGGNPAVIAALLEAGADVAARDNENRTPLHYAADSDGNSAAVAALLEAGADVTARDNEGRTPLYRAAARTGNLAVVNALLAADAEPCEMWNTPSFFRIAIPKDVTACLATGADVVARDDQARTPLHYASESTQSSAVVGALLAAGAALKARDNEARTPLHYAGESNGNPAVVETLLAAGADVTAQDNENRTPLHYAAESNESPPVVAALLEAGANVNARDSNDYTPLHTAARFNANSDVAALLLSEGADVTARDFAGFTASYLAQDNTNPNVLRILVNAEANVRNPLFDVTPLRDSNRFLWGRFSFESPLEPQASADPGETQRDIRTFLEAQVAGDVPILGQQRVRHLAGNVGGTLDDREFHAAHQLYATMMIRLRMTTGESTPIPAPSFMPKITYQRLAFRLSAQSASTIVFTLAFGHHSNGHAGCPFEGQDRRGANTPCMPLPDSSPRPTINDGTGSFSTHYIQSGLYYRRADLPRAGFTFGEIAYGASIEYHLPCIKGALCELRDRYGGVRLSTSGGLTLRGVTGFDRIAVRSTVQGILGPDVRNPYAIAFEVVPFITPDFGPYLRTYSGQDYYNVHFDKHLRRLEIGLTFAWGDIVRGLPSPF